MVVGEMPERADLVVVGAGPGGYTAALRAAAAGRSVLLVDAAGADGVGGVCLLEGCIPSKALLELATARHDVGRRTAMGLMGRRERVDLVRFQAWKDELIRGLGDAVRARLERAGVEIVAGRARLDSPRLLRVDRPDAAPRLLEFDGAVLATGSTSVEPGALAGDARVVDAAGALALTSLPARLVVVGGGYVGTELATAFAKLGSAVTVIEAGPRLLPSLDRHVAHDVAAGLARLGVTVLVGTSVTALATDGVLVEGEGGATAVPADIILSAVGRRPATAGLGLEVAKITTTPTGHVVVDARRLATPRIAAIGDLIPGPGLAHKAISDAEIAIAALTGGPMPPAPLVPLVVFSDPEAAAVGLSREEAEALGHRVEERVMPVAAVGRAWMLGEPHGQRRLVVDADSGLLLGATLTSPHASELLAEYGLAVEAGLLADDLAATLHPHPTLSELASA